MVFADLNRNFLSGVKADEGEPSGVYKVDLEGSVSINHVGKGVANVKQSDVRTAGFKQFNGTRLDPSIRIYGPKATVTQDIKPEFIVFLPDSLGDGTGSKRDRVSGCGFSDVYSVSGFRFAGVYGL